MLDLYTSTIHTHCPNPSLEARSSSKCGAILEIPYPSNSQSHALEFLVPISLPHTSLNHSNSFCQKYENPPTLAVKREKMLANYAPTTPKNRNSNARCSRSCLLCCFASSILSSFVCHPVSLLLLGGSSLLSLQRLLRFATRHL